MMNTIHYIRLHYIIRFVELLVACGAQTTVRTATQQMTVLHVLFLLGKKSAEDTLQTAKLLLDHGLRELINEADSLGNTPLHALIVRYALEEAKYGLAMVVMETGTKSLNRGINGTCFILYDTSSTRERVRV